jgi:hypothetical protein
MLGELTRVIDSDQAQQEHLGGRGEGGGCGSSTDAPAMHWFASEGARNTRVHAKLSSDDKDQGTKPCVPQCCSPHDQNDCQPHHPPPATYNRHNHTPAPPLACACAYRWQWTDGAHGGETGELIQCSRVERNHRSGSGPPGRCLVIVIVVVVGHGKTKCSTHAGRWLSRQSDGERRQRWRERQSYGCV